MSLLWSSVRIIFLLTCQSATQIRLLSLCPRSRMNSWFRICLLTWRWSDSWPVRWSPNAEEVSQPCFPDIIILHCCMTVYRSTAVLYTWHQLLTPYKYSWNVLGEFVSSVHSVMGWDTKVNFSPTLNGFVCLIIMFINSNITDASEWWIHWFRDLQNMALLGSLNT